MKVEHGSSKEKIKYFREPHKKDQKETENSETTKRAQTKEENEPHEEKSEIKHFEKSVHANEGIKHLRHMGGWVSI